MTEYDEALSLNCNNGCCFLYLASQSKVVAISVSSSGEILKPVSKYSFMCVACESYCSRVSVQCTLLLVDQYNVTGAVMRFFTLTVITRILIDAAMTRVVDALCIRLYCSILKQSGSCFELYFDSVHCTSVSYLGLEIS